MKRGEIWTAAGGKDYAAKPRPAVVVQDDTFDANDSVTVCPFTTDEFVASLIRLVVAPDDLNGLRSTSRLMVDKVSTLPRTKLRHRIGNLGDEDILRLNRALAVFLGLGSSKRVKRPAAR
jgi:mRNA interferase MazF